MTLGFLSYNCMTLVLMSQNSRPYHMGKCHVGRKADVALTWQKKKTSQNKFGLLKNTCSILSFHGPQI